MSDYTKKHEAANVPLGPLKDSQEPLPIDVSKMRSDKAAADKSKRESGKDKEHRKR